MAEDFAVVTEHPSIIDFVDGLQRINSLNPSQVFQTLREKLPYEETRNYLPTVNTNRKRYYSLDKTIVENDKKQTTATATE